MKKLMTIFGFLLTCSTSFAINLGGSKCLLTTATAASSTTRIIKMVPGSPNQNRYIESYDIAPDLRAERVSSITFKIVNLNNNEELLSSGDVSSHEFKDGNTNYLTEFSQTAFEYKGLHYHMSCE